MSPERNLTFIIKVKFEEPNGNLLGAFIVIGDTSEKKLYACHPVIIHYSKTFADTANPLSPWPAFLVTLKQEKGQISDPVLLDLIAKLTAYYGTIDPQWVDRVSHTLLDTPNPHLKNQMMNDLILEDLQKLFADGNPGAQTSVETDSISARHLLGMVGVDEKIPPEEEESSGKEPQQDPDKQDAEQQQELEQPSDEDSGAVEEQVEADGPSEDGPSEDEPSADEPPEDEPPETEEEKERRLHLEELKRKKEEEELKRKKEEEAEVRRLAKEKKKKDKEERIRKEAEEAEARLKAEEDRKKLAKKKKLEEEERRRKEAESAEARRKAEEKLKQEEEEILRRKEEEEARRKEEEKKKREEKLRRKKEEEEKARRKAEEDRKKLEDRRKKEEERQRKEEEEAQRKIEEENRKKLEQRRKREEERQRKEEEEAQRKLEEEKKKKEEKKKQQQKIKKMMVQLDKEDKQERLKQTRERIKTSMSDTSDEEEEATDVVRLGLDPVNGTPAIDLEKKDSVVAFRKTGFKLPGRVKSVKRNKVNPEYVIVKIALSDKVVVKSEVYFDTKIWIDRNPKAVKEETSSVWSTIFKVCLVLFLVALLALVLIFIISTA